MKKNGTTTKGTTRWRCTTPDCGISTVQPRAHTTDRHHFTAFIGWINSTASLSTIAADYGVTRRTLTRWFADFWFIQLPDNTDPHRVYDQVFIDGTYFHNTCLLVACTTDHVLAWHWCATENSFNYGTLLQQLAPPQVVTTDGHRGALKAITTHWPTSKVQRCLIHVKRNIQNYVTTRPATPAGKALRRLSLQLLAVETSQQAADWTLALHRFHSTFGAWLNEKSYLDDVDPAAVPRFARHNTTWWYTHYRQRSAYRLLERLYKAGNLFVYLNRTDLNERALKATTNHLEGGVNAQLKHLARAHRGTFDEHQRIIMDWWLYQHTENPQTPESIAHAQDFGRVGKRQAVELIEQDRQQRSGPSDGRPVEFDTGIEHSQSQWVRHGWAGRSH